MPQQAFTSLDTYTGSLTLVMTGYPQLSGNSSSLTAFLLGIVSALNMLYGAAASATANVTSVNVQPEGGSTAAVEVSYTLRFNSSPGTTAAERLVVEDSLVALVTYRCAVIGRKPASGGRGSLSEGASPHACVYELCHMPISCQSTSLSPLHVIPAL